MGAEITGNRADGLLRRVCSHDLGALASEHGGHELEQGFVVGVGAGRDRAARMIALALIDRLFALSVLARDAEGRADAGQNQSAGLVGRGHGASLLCASR